MPKFPKELIEIIERLEKEGVDNAVAIGIIEWQNNRVTENTEKMKKEIVDLKITIEDKTKEYEEAKQKTKKELKDEIGILKDKMKALLNEGRS